MKRGGALSIVHHEIEMLVRADAIPDAVEIDVSALDIGDSIHIDDVTFAAGQKPVIHEKNYTILSITAPAGWSEAAAAAPSA